MKLKKPFEKKYRITQKFGAKYEYKGKTVTHKGVDFATPKNTEILAPCNGVVSRIEKYRLHGYGKSVYIRTENGTAEILLAHLNKITCEVNQRVYKGETTVGYSGRTGFWRGKTGYHLHFGLKIKGKYTDPLPYMAEYSESLLSSEEMKKLDVKNNDQKYYKVKKGDTLSHIAQKMYNNSNLWVVIYKENKKLIGSDPNLIYPGQRIKIPKL